MTTTLLKFGGSSLATPERVHRVARLVADTNAEKRVIVVVSAFGGATDDLLSAAAAAATGPHNRSERPERASHPHEDRWQKIDRRHRDAARALAASPERTALEHAVRALTQELQDLLRGVALLRECSPRTRDGIVSYGERLSALLVAAALRAAGTEATTVDARTLIVTDDAFGHATVDMDTSRRCIRAGLHDEPPNGVAVVTGFIAATPTGQTTTLGRGGSDYTAALLGAALDADAIELWTDVSGVLSADPRQVPEAFPQAHMAYAELMELSHFGAKVVYPPTVHPAREHGIPLLIKNTLDSAAPGTVITEQAPATDRLVRGITSIPHVALMRLEGDGMVGVPGIASRLFGALAACQVSVILISQASSEHSICFAVAPHDAERGRAAVDEAFALEVQAGLVRPLVVEDDLAVVAAVGEALRDRPGVAGTVFTALGNQGINVRAIAQGSSERNISLVVARDDEAGAVQTIHRAFFGPASNRPRVVRVAICGVGRVGGALLDQLRDAMPRLRENEGTDIRVEAIMSSRFVVTATKGDAGIDLETWRQALDDASSPSSWAAAREALCATPDATTVFVDCTASDTVATWYPPLLAAGVHVVAANKRAFAGPLGDWHALHDAARSGGSTYRFEAAVGAGLPVLAPLHDLMRAGDTVHRIEGLLSGTLGAVLDDLDQGTPFSVAVRRAFEAGFTEPHPWEDLSGADVGRKLCILARRAGHEIEPESVQVEPLLAGDGWAGTTLDTFWDRLPSVDEAFEARRSQAAARGERLRYVATFAPDGQGARVATVAVAADHPAHAVTGPDNLIAITTERYRQHPLVIRGPGAGPAVTATGVVGDLLAIADLARASS